MKDRAALYIVEEAERSGALKPGGTVCEGTGGNTGVALAMVAAAKGYKAIFALPETISPEKIEVMKTFGAEVIACPICPFTDNRHFFHQAAASAQNGTGQNILFTNQFENAANQRAHFEGTGPEIWRQTEGKVDGFVCSAGTGGTIAGCSQYLKSQNPNCATYLMDPEGSALFDFVNSSVVSASADPSHAIESAASQLEAKDVHGSLTRFIPRSPGSSIAEGIGIDRVTGNFRRSQLDGALTARDTEMVEMAYYLKDKEGIFVGPSSALNVLGAVQLARKLGPGHTIVTILCDSGDRYRTTLFSEEFLKKKGLENTHRSDYFEQNALAPAAPASPTTSQQV